MSIFIIIIIRIQIFGGLEMRSSFMEIWYSEKLKISGTKFSLVKL